MASATSSLSLQGDGVTSLAAWKTARGVVEGKLSRHLNVHGVSLSCDVNSHPALASSWMSSVSLRAVAGAVYGVWTATAAKKREAEGKAFLQLLVWLDTQPDAIPQLPVTTEIDGEVNLAQPASSVVVEGSTRRL